MQDAIKIANLIYEAATPVIQIHGLTSFYWKRNTANGPVGDRDSRIGPWQQGKYSVLNEPIWKEIGACLYLVKENEVIRYVGISRKRLKDRWRLSPAYDAETMKPLPEKQLFHSQCWHNIQRAVKDNPDAVFEVRMIKGVALTKTLNMIGPPLTAFAAFADDNDDESMVASIERWICNRSSDALCAWNVAMTNKVRVIKR